MTHTLLNTPGYEGLIKELSGPEADELRTQSSRGNLIACAGFYMKQEFDSEGLYNMQIHHGIHALRYARCPDGFSTCEAVPTITHPAATLRALMTPVRTSGTSEHDAAVDLVFGGLVLGDRPLALRAPADHALRATKAYCDAMCYVSHLIFDYLQGTQLATHYASDDACGAINSVHLNHDEVRHSIELLVFKNSWKRDNSNVSQHIVDHTMHQYDWLLKTIVNPTTSRTFRLYHAERLARANDAKVKQLEHELSDSGQRARAALTALVDGTFSTINSLLEAYKTALEDGTEPASAAGFQALRPPRSTDPTWDSNAATTFDASKRATISLARDVDKLLRGIARAREEAVTKAVEQVTAEALRLFYAHLMQSEIDYTALDQYFQTYHVTGGAATNLFAIRSWLAEPPAAPGAAPAPDVAGALRILQRILDLMNEANSVAATVTELIPKADETYNLPTGSLTPFKGIREALPKVAAEFYANRAAVANAATWAVSVLEVLHSMMGEMQLCVLDDTAYDRQKEAGDGFGGDWIKVFMNGLPQAAQAPVQGRAILLLQQWWVPVEELRKHVKRSAALGPVCATVAPLLVAILRFARTVRREVTWTDQQIDDDIVKTVTDNVGGGLVTPEQAAGIRATLREVFADVDERASQIVRAIAAFMSEHSRVCRAWDAYSHDTRGVDAHGNAIPLTIPRHCQTLLDAVTVNGQDYSDLPNLVRADMDNHHACYLARERFRVDVLALPGHLKKFFAHAAVPGDTPVENLARTLNSIAADAWPGAVGRPPDWDEQLQAALTAYRELRATLAGAPAGGDEAEMGDADVDGEAEPGSDRAQMPPSGSKGAPPNRRDAMATARKLRSRIQEQNEKIAELEASLVAHELTIKDLQEKLAAAPARAAAAEAAAPAPPQAGFTRREFFASAYVSARAFAKWVKLDTMNDIFFWEALNAELGDRASAELFGGHVPTPKEFLDAARSDVGNITSDIPDPYARFTAALGTVQGAMVTPYAMKRTLVEGVRGAVASFADVLEMAGGDAGTFMLALARRVDSNILLSTFPVDAALDPAARNLEAAKALTHYKDTSTKPLHEDVEHEIQSLKRRMYDAGIDALIGAAEAAVTCQGDESAFRSSFSGAVRPTHRVLLFNEGSALDLQDSLATALNACNTEEYNRLHAILQRPQGVAPASPVYDPDKAFAGGVATAVCALDVYLRGGLTNTTNFFSQVALTAGEDYCRNNLGIHGDNMGGVINDIAKNYAPPSLQRKTVQTLNDLSEAIAEFGRAMITAGASAAAEARDCTALSFCERLNEYLDDNAVNMLRYETDYTARLMELRTEYWERDNFHKEKLGAALAMIAARGQAPTQASVMEGSKIFAFGVAAGVGTACKSVAHGSYSFDDLLKAVISKASRSRIDDLFFRGDDQGENDVARLNALSQVLHTEGSLSDTSDALKDAKTAVHRLAGDLLTATVVAARSSGDFQNLFSDIAGKLSESCRHTLFGPKNAMRDNTFQDLERLCTSTGLTGIRDAMNKRVSGSSHAGGTDTNALLDAVEGMMRKSMDWAFDPQAGIDLLAFDRIDIDTNHPHARTVAYVQQALYSGAVIQRLNLQYFNMADGAGATAQLVANPKAIGFGLIQLMETLRALLCKGVDSVNIHDILRASIAAGFYIDSVSNELPYPAWIPALLSDKETREMVEKEVNDITDRIVDLTNSPSRTNYSMPKTQLLPAAVPPQTSPAAGGNGKARKTGEREDTQGESGDTQGRDPAPKRKKKSPVPGEDHGMNGT
jgi:uncharacterized coiled-coil protein SlyX